MQALNGEQADSIMDLVSQCRVVSVAWEQADAEEARYEDAPQPIRDDANAYTRPLKILIDLYARAEYLEVSAVTLIAVITRNLPKALAGQINLEPAA